MSKFAKIIIGIVGFVLIVAGVAVWLFISNINTVAKQGIEHFGSEALGTEVRVANVDLSPFDGKGSISGLTIANPDGFTPGNAFALKQVRVAVDVESLTGSVIRIHEITVDGADLLVEQRLKDGTNNLDVLRKNAEKYAGVEPVEDDSAQRKITIKQFNFLDADVKVVTDVAGDQNVSIPDIRLTDIGDANNGVSIGEAVSRMIKPIVKAAVKDALKGQVKDRLKGELDKVIGGNDKLKSLKSLFGGAKEPPSD